MLTKTIRSRFDHAVGQQVAGCTIIERVVVIPPNPVERRLGVYDYLVEVPPVPAKVEPKRRNAAPEPGSFTRSTPDAVKGGVIRRVPSR